MLIIESETGDGARLRELAATCNGNAEVFENEDGAGGVVLCDAQSGQQAESTTLRQVETRLTGGQFGNAAGPHLLLVGAWMPDDFRTEFLAWYEVDHMPLLLACSTWDGCRIVEEQVTDGNQFYALHQASDPAAWASEERNRARSTPWFQRLAANDWFAGLTRQHFLRIDG